MIISNGRIVKKTYCSNCMSIIIWDDVKDEKSQMGHRMITCPKCGAEEEIFGDDVIVTQTDVIESPKAYINNVAYATTEEALNALSAGDSIKLEEDVSLVSLNIPDGASIDFNGHSATIANMITQSGDAVLKNGVINFTGSNDGLNIIEGATVVLDNMDITTKRNGISATDSTLILNDSKVKAQEAAIFAAKGSRIEINGGNYSTIDNGVIMDNGSKGRGGNKIVINDGVFTGNITSPGYLAHIIYLANDDSITINGGTFNVTDGSAIVVRGGSLTVSSKAQINASGTDAGKVGDGSTAIPAGYDIVVDRKIKYPAVDTIKIKAPGRNILEIQE